ncbi:hypothetical protein NX059_008052 [Plenodomus lindquistii]|nr:hypothetical protein NX059_008052 [Plenodomus lindquistii]
MDASTRLYQRLAEIPEDPEDPESLADLIVCAFGAFERYFICWKTKGGDFRQDGHDLPPALRDWLYPRDGTTRDFPSLQVVFGRGEEYFASDKNGKLEFKEPEAKKPVEDEDRIDRRALRRSRTVSFLRPLSETSVKSDATSADSLSSRESRSSSVSSQRASRPPSLSYSRTNSDVSFLSRSNSRPPSIPSSHTRAQSSFGSQWTTLDEESAAQKSPGTRDNTTDSAVGDLVAKEVITETYVQQPALDIDRIQRKSPSREKAPRSFINALRSKADSPIQSTPPCTCGCHVSSASQATRPAYANASVQTDPTPSPPRTALRIDTTTPLMWPSRDSSSAVSQELDYPEIEANPLIVGRSLDYFSKPNYQLGDSLVFGYHDPQPHFFQFQDEFGDEALQ